MHSRCPVNLVDLLQPIAAYNYAFAVPIDHGVVFHVCCDGVCVLLYLACLCILLCLQLRHVPF